MLFFQTIARELHELPRVTLESAKETHSVRALTGTSMLMALSVLLNQFTLFFTQMLRLSFTFLPIAVSGMLYGPVVTGFAGVAVDILKYFTRNDGGVFFPGFTLNEFLRGFIYGVIFYKKQITLSRVIVAQLLTTGIISLILNPLWLSMMYGQAFIGLVAVRLVKNVVLFPVEVCLLYFLLKKTAEIRAKSLV